jgi:hypothetical protein
LREDYSVQDIELEAKINQTQKHSEKLMEATVKQLLVARGIPRFFDFNGAWCGVQLRNLQHVCVEELPPTGD